MVSECCIPKGSIPSAEVHYLNKRCVEHGPHRLKAGVLVLVVSPNCPTEALVLACSHGDVHRTCACLRVDLCVCGVARPVHIRKGRKLGPVSCVACAGIICKLYRFMRTAFVARIRGLCVISWVVGPESGQVSGATFFSFSLLFCFAKCVSFGA